MSSDVALTSALRQNLNSLQRISGDISNTSNILSTGKEVNSVFDDPVNFSRAKSFSDRAGDLDRVLDNISQSKRTVEAAQNGAKSVESLLDSARSLVDQAQEELGQGSGGTASITGENAISENALSDSNSDLNDLTSPELELIANDGEGSTVKANIDLTTVDTADQLAADINAQSDVVEAEIVDGKLKLSAVNDGSLRISFDAGTSNSTNDQTIADALGIGNQVQAETRDGTDRLAAVVNQGPTLTGSLVDPTSGDAIDASATLNTAENVTGSGNLNFNLRDNGGNKLDQVQVSLSDSVQNLVDSINNGESGNFLRASFDDDTGKLSITSINESLAGVEVEAATGGEEFNIGLAGQSSDLSTDTKADDIGADGNTDGATANTTASTGADAQFIRFGASAGKLGQIEESFNELRSQIDNATTEARIAGTNLLKGDSLQTFFDTQREQSLTTQGVNFTSAGLGLEEANFASQSNVDSFRNDVIAARNDVRAFSSRITTDLNVIDTRRSLAENTQQTLESAAGDLTQADQNEEAAKLSALQTRQQLANQSLSIAVQSQQSVLQILR
jgi:flagellin-like hook-associated protein FlgL